MTYSMFPQLLKTYRAAYPISQLQLSYKAGLDNSLISRLEAGTREPSRVTVRALSIALELDPNQADKLLVTAGFLPRQAHILALIEEALQDGQ